MNLHVPRKHFSLERNKSLKDTIKPTARSSLIEKLNHPINNAEEFTKAIKGFGWNIFEGWLYNKMKEGHMIYDRD